MCAGRAFVCSLIGYDGGGNRLFSVERYDEEKDEWEAVTDMNNAREGAGACVLGGRVYAVGGSGGGNK